MFQQENLNEIKMSQYLFFLIIVGVVLMTSAGIIRKMEGCKPRPVLFNINHKSSEPPQYIELYRCMGADDGYASNFRCVSVTEKAVFLRLSSTRSTYFNHTECGMRCACNKGQHRASSGCDSPKKHVFCYPGNVWNDQTCRCEPDITFIS